ncbi:carbohydrate ABC transporter permease [Rathayibacter sp. VKM Ac-2760]|uniref:carbohydrate ABC transporter permease n=1 Tax=Rathayibacter sp. VKM Ac-2760 TaxID=2609253 RepID=UPI0013191A55|nr:carbohydrate ABC transporter permease [Rathayibacter sp. VKM Ac-2760]QHC58789.1 ABC transporter permease subunit [Rathayibacter sp. VKM Ac-2760]
MTSRSTTASAARHTVSAAIALVFLLPLLWTLVSSLTGRGASSDGGFGFANYTRVIDYGSGFGTYFGNTAALAVMTVIGVLLVAVPGGYAFARLRFPGKNALFVLTLAILMVPYATLLIPLYVLLGWLGLQDSLVGLALVMIMLQLPFSLFMMRNSFDSLPRELDEAAYVDGCGSMGAFRRVLLPGVVPGVVTISLYAFLASWNEFIAPLIFLTSGSGFTLPVALVSLRSGSLGQVDYGALQAGVIVSALPCLFLFLLLQRYYVRGFTSGALKG